MERKMLKPKYLTKEIAARAVHSVSPIVQNMRDLLSREMCSIIILVPSIDDGYAEKFADYPEYEVKPYVLYTEKLGDPDKWPRKYDKIAANHALQLWYDRIDDRTDCMPHLLFPGDTPFWGGVKRHGIVVSCCGFQPWFSKMVSSMIADMCIYLSYNVWMRSTERVVINKDSQRSFLE